MQTENANPAEILLGKLTHGYGYPQGIDTMPPGLSKTCQKLYHAILAADRSMLEAILHPSNPRSREAFETLLSDSGAVRLPKTVKGTNELIAGFVSRLQSAFAQEPAKA